MLAVFLTTGLIGSAVTSGDIGVTTPASRTVTLTPTGSIPSAQQYLDPSDVLDFVLDMSSLLASGEQFSQVDLRVTATSALQGFEVMEDAPYQAVPLDNGRIRIWVTVAIEKRDAQQWTKSASCQIEVTAVTNSEPARTWQRTAQIAVGQR